MRYKILVFLLVILTVVLNNNVSADEFTLQDGKTIQGFLVEAGQGIVRVATPDGIVELNVPDLAKIVLTSREYQGSVQDIVLEGDQVNSRNASNLLQEFILDQWSEEKKFSEKINTLFFSEQFSELEEIIKQIRAEQSHYLSGDLKIHDYYNSIVNGLKDEPSLQYYSDTEKILQKWIDSMPESATPKILMAYLYSRMGWAYRGGGYNNTISEKGSKRFEEYIQKSWDLFMDIETNAPESDKDEFFYSLLVLATSDMGYSQTKAYKYFRLATNKNPFYGWPYGQLSFRALPRWGGSNQMVEEFAKNAFDENKGGWGDYHYFYIAEGIRYILRDEFRAELNLDWEIIKSGIWHLYKEYPGNLAVVNKGAQFACIYKDQETAKKLLDIIGQRWNKESDDIWGDRSRFDNCRAWANNVKNEHSDPMDSVFKAVSEKNYTLLQQYSEEGKDLNIKNEAGETPLIWALSNQEGYLANVLIDLGVDVNVADKLGNTPLHHAALNGDFNLVQMLLEKGANDLIKNNYGETVLHFAALQGFSKIVQTLAERPLADIYAKNIKGITPMHIAAEKGHTDVLEVFYSLDQKSLDVTDYYRRTPVQMAAQNGFESTVSYLVDKGVDLNIATTENKTALNYADDIKNESMRRLLLEHGAVDMDAKARKDAYEKSGAVNSEGIVHMNNNEFDQALKMFDEAISFMPSNPLPYGHKASIIFQEEKNYEKALELINKAIRLGPNRYSYYLLRGKIYLDMDKQNLARQDFITVVSYAPQSEEAKIIRTEYKDIVE